MAVVDFVGQLHKKTSRNYLERVCEHDKIECATVAKRYGQEYWDGDRRYGYGGYRYDGRWSVVAEGILKRYDPPKGGRVLDVGCGKGFLLYEMSLLRPDLEFVGVDISEYGLENAKPEIRDQLQFGNARELPFADASFDLVVSLGTLHNLKVFDLKKALGEITRVLRDPTKAYVMVESFRNEAERVNLLYWQLTCESFYDVDEWAWLFREWGYKGDHSFIFFE